MKENNRDRRFAIEMTVHRTEIGKVLRPIAIEKDGRQLVVEKVHLVIDSEGIAEIDRMIDVTMTESTVSPGHYRQKNHNGHAHGHAPEVVRK